MSASDCVLCHSFRLDSYCCPECFTIFCPDCAHGTVCPFCKCTITKDFSTTFKKMLLRTHRLCSMCKKYIPLQVLNHDSVCPARTVSCPFCHVEMPFKEYITHVPVHADELLSISHRFQEIPESFQNYHAPFTLNYICNNCRVTSRNPSSGGGRFRCLDCQDYDLCGACFVRHCMKPGAIHNQKHRFTLLNPSSLVSDETMSTHCHGLMLAQDSPVGTEAATANALYTVLFIRSLSGALADNFGDKFTCDDCKEEFSRYSVRWHKQDTDSNLCSSCIGKRVFSGASQKDLGHIPVRPNGTNVFENNTLLKSFGLFRDPNPSTI